MATKEVICEKHGTQQVAVNRRTKKRTARCPDCGYRKGKRR